MRGAAWLLVPGMLLAAGGQGGTPVEIRPGESLAAAVDSHPKDTTFLLRAGIHRMQSARPKNGNLFQGERGAILSGAKLLVSFAREGSHWVASGQTQQGQTNGACQSAHPGCAYPEDLFVDDVPLRHVRTLPELGPGRWHFDYRAGRIYLGENPAGRRVETSVLRHAFQSTASNVTIRGLVIEKYAVPAQCGAIQAAAGLGDNDELGTGWLVESNELRLNHGAAIRLGHRMRILGNYIHHNGQIGMVGRGDDVRVESNEIAFNNYAGFNAGWEAGGAKFVKTNRLVARGNFCHDNSGPGMWTDIDNYQSLYENNIVTGNSGAGIFHEISYDAVIRGNIVRRNGKGFDAWIWGAQILVSSSRNTEVHSNLVEVDAEGGDGIALAQQNRGAGTRGRRLTTGNWVHHNTVIYRGPAGQSGAAADFDGETMYRGNNRFDENLYVLPSPAGATRRPPGRRETYWTWRGDQVWEGFRAHGQESRGAVVLETEALEKP